MISRSQGVYEIGYIDPIILSCIGVAKASRPCDLIVALLQDRFIIDLIASIPGETNDHIRILLQYPFGLHRRQCILRGDACIHPEAICEVSGNVYSPGKLYRLGYPLPR